MQFARAIRVSTHAILLQGDGGDAVRDPRRAFPLRIAISVPANGRTSESVVFEWIQEIDPELVKIAHVAGHDRQPMHQGRRGDHGILQQGV